MSQLQLLCCHGEQVGGKSKRRQKNEGVAIRCVMLGAARASYIMNQVTIKSVIFGL